MKGKLKETKTNIGWIQKLDNGQQWIIGGQEIKYWSEGLQQTVNTTAGNQLLHFIAEIRMTDANLLLPTK